jgi:hypothetical protein
LSRQALAALRLAAPRIIGQLVDVLLDVEASPVVRRRIPRVLETTKHARAARGLVDALSSELSEVRHQSALALHRMCDGKEDIHIPSGPVLAAARQELDRLAAASKLTPRSLDALVAMLSLVLDREPLALAHRALYTSDATLRGTALEYLENVLPDSLRSMAMSVFARVRESEEQAPLSLRRRGRHELVEELLRSREYLSVTVPTDPPTEP